MAVSYTAKYKSSDLVFPRISKLNAFQSKYFSERNDLVFLQLFTLQ